MINESFHYLKKKMKNDIQEIEVLFIYLSLLAIIWLKNNNNNKTKGHLVFRQPNVNDLCL